MQVDTALLRLPPVFRNTLVDVCLVNNLWDQLRPAIDQRAVGRRDLGAVNGVCGGIFDKEREEREDTADEEGNDEEVDEEEYQEAPPHRGIVVGGVARKPCMSSRRWS